MAGAVSLIVRTGVFVLALALLGSTSIGAQRGRTTHPDLQGTWSGGTFRCTNGTTYTVTSNDGLWETTTGGAANRMKLASATDCTTATNCARYSRIRWKHG